MISAGKAESAGLGGGPMGPRLYLYNGRGKGSRRLEFHLFDAPYVNRLTAGDPATESHFSAYFRRFLGLKLQARRLSPAFAEDVLQETMFRVLRALRQGAGVSQPERFGAFVNTVCNNVVLEFLNKEKRHPPAPEDSPEPIDDRENADASMISAERKRMVGEVLDSLKPKDREILRLVFLEETDRESVCQKLGVEAEYLRVLLHRAKERFAQAYVKRGGATQARMLMCL